MLITLLVNRKVQWWVFPGAIFCQNRDNKVNGPNPPPTMAEHKTERYYLGHAKEQLMQYR